MQSRNISEINLTSVLLCLMIVNLVFIGKMINNAMQ